MAIILPNKSDYIQYLALRVFTIKVCIMSQKLSKLVSSLCVHRYKLFFFIWMSRESVFDRCIYRNKLFSLQCAIELHKCVFVLCKDENEHSAMVEVNGHVKYWFKGFK